MKLTNTQHAELEAKVSELVALRDKIVTDANQQVAFVNGRIQQLQELIAGGLEEEADGRQPEAGETAVP